MPALMSGHIFVSASYQYTEEVSLLPFLAFRIYWEKTSTEGRQLSGFEDTSHPSRLCWYPIPRFDTFFKSTLAFLRPKQEGLIIASMHFMAS